ncbi:SpoVR family protein [Ectothiorhodospira haloalkaliphila]|uniref:SpoVR family protein n=1 Tax=Ectothiorhodospira haloalkaliphila TaxID=421628 RepID=W8KFR4_9GAMM|nr:MULTISPECIES: SpoVR family protein [Ectothiorhodospira]AHK78023.1 SpoVR family protein [Ectothiorhodospira haloalkaliphila]MCG5494258.1 SpoVR family protein [Ectothiorhodospira variabilis]MCG5496423.1 SpoVR family protein [Ectothiorhodospira variabilis]MCG5504796.1 SpoVR family protein [Ectothiorhodospira variabilis]MCG5507953.1 SpoVR family protein [Ectothiorhodospira variabilis]
MNTITDDACLLYTGADWDYALIKRAHDAIERIAVDEMGLDPYPSQVEVISSEQMLDAYSSMGMPLFYRHWSFGKHFARDEMYYRKGMTGLAYEIVINSNPCLCYIMEENTMTMQTLVMAHAAFGHSHFFKNNHLFKSWTDAEGILDYLDFAKSYVAQCEERYGRWEVERVLDAAHALMSHGVHRYPRRQPLNLVQEMQRKRDRARYEEQTFNDLWRTLPRRGDEDEEPGAQDVSARHQALGLPEENLLYFLEKRAPKLEHWQREILRIVRMVSQYFYPQKQTKVMNEGCATSVHYHIMNRLYETGQVTEGAFMEFLHQHTNVVFQPEFDDPRFSGINPYALGFNILQDLKRMCLAPTAEDRRWFPDIAGNGDFLGTWKHAWAEYRDESFILQFLGPKVMRDMRLFAVHDDAAEPHLKVEAIHDDAGYREVRRALSAQYDLARHEPDIQVVDVDLAGDRKLILEHRAQDGRLLEEKDARRVLQHLANLWGYAVRLYEVDARTDTVINEFVDVEPTQP